MARKFFNECSMSVAIRQMQIKMMLRFYHTSVRMATIRNTNDNKHTDVGDTETLDIVCRSLNSLKAFWKPVWKISR